jgi:hypothetical protein
MRKWGKKLFIAAGFVLASALGALVFFTRAPVLVVTDDSFDVLYGKQRGWEKFVRTSLRLWRPVVMVRIAENAGTDMVAFAVEEAAAGREGDAPVLIPYRYYAGAVRYRAQNPQARVAVLEGRGVQVRTGSPASPGLVSIGTDSVSDLYRAGGAAAVLAGEGTILFFHDRNLTERERGAFLQGLRDNSYGREPVFLASGSEYNDLDDVSCAVLGASAASLLDKYTNIPLIVFSWVDPALTPSNVYLVFDDSPWALAVEAVKLLEAGDENEGVSLPSRILFPRGRIDKSEILQKLKECTNKNLP